MKAVLLAAALAALAVPTVQAPAPPAQEAVAVGADLDGNVVLFHSTDFLDHASTCYAPAPCRTGPHSLGFGFILHGVFVGPLQTGSYSSALIEDIVPVSGRSRVLTCAATPVSLSCQQGGSWPTSGSHMYQNCAFAAVDGGCFLFHF